eukprot:GILK01016703.1.p1 GENE.GILK01016703.1~~GILK01016703.1.p1  ORF type:complete len:716 (+),score=100.23 GILK01016703.1:77-2149(+)
MSANDSNIDASSATHHQNTITIAPNRANPNAVYSSISKAVAAANGAAVSSTAGGGNASHISAIRSIAQQNSLSSIGKKPADVSMSVKGSHNIPPDAASAEYFAFLRQQQEIQKNHNRIDEAIVGLEEGRRDRQADITKIRASSAALLKDIEENADWKLRSKYDTQQLIRDCALSLQVAELVDGASANVSAITAVGAHLEGLKQEHNATLQFAPYGLMVDQSLRRLSLLENSLADGNYDFTPLARSCDTMLVQLQNNCELPTLESLITKQEAFIDTCSCKIEDMRAKRQAAMADGEVHVTEKLCYDIIDQYESLADKVINKARTLEEASKDTAVMLDVKDQYLGPIPDLFAQIRTRQQKLRDRCTDDMKKMFALREKVEEVEASTVQKVASDVQSSDRVLAANTERVHEVFGKMMALEKELEQLEQERNREMQRRLAEKDKDEHRKAEYSKFIATVEGHTIPLERTVKNTDLMTHGADVVEELLLGGFGTISSDLNERAKLLRVVRIETHKEHVEVFRALLVELGDIIYRKERMIEEIDKKVQQAHIQQELLAETFNPNARKFGEMKKSLLASRDELEEDVEHLKKRAEAALTAFHFSERALHEADVEFVHPVTEQQHHTLAMRAKMIEYKAMVAGHNKGESALMEDIEQLQREVNDTRGAMDGLNSTTTGTVSRSIPLIRAANKTRLGVQ